MRFDFLRADNVDNFDLSMIKNVDLSKGRMLQVRLEALDGLNHPLFPGPGGNSLTPTSVQFGSIVTSTQLNYARRTQATIRFLF
jgi:hypothetical protein